MLLPTSSAQLTGPARPGPASTTPTCAGRTIGYQGAMCFSATASFTSSAVISDIGVATLAQVRHAREIPFAALPALFAVHQFAEGR